MARILNIDTAVDSASLCIADNETVIAYTENKIPHTQSGWIHNALQELFQSVSLQLSDLDAIAVSNGPGSYTGLRIGLATAKGLCFALNKPLICLNTLEIMANAVKTAAAQLICPVIDARRMEVYTAVYTKDLTTISAPASLILDEYSFQDLLQTHKILFTGNALSKIKKIINHSNAAYSDLQFSAAHMPFLSLQRYHEQAFDNLSYAEPFYLKAVYFNKN